MKYALVVNRVSKQFDDSEQSFSFKKLLKKDQFHAVTDVSLKIKQGEIFGVLGPNGCGKSTLIRMISTLLVPDKGYIKVFSKNIGRDDGKIRKMINRVSVDAAFFKKLSSWENLIYAARLYGLNKSEAKEKTEDILTRLNFQMDKLNMPMQNLSRGQQQKVAIARAFLSSPMLILLDEPTTGLDPKSKIDVQKFIKKIMKERKNVGILLTTHDMAEAENLCDRVSIMNDGKIIAEGKSEKLKKVVREKGIYEIKVNKDIKKLRDYLKKSKRVSNVVKGKKKVRFYVKNINTLLAPLSNFLKKNNLKLTYLRMVNPSLEDVFISLTGKGLEDE
ncbi:MAG: ABC transporter [Nanoarchaeota archaeon]|jgi:ABC-2 type transport system ATP-binding protein|nr:ABC transporter [Nanoarchaeota archaeon]|tara:strand:+ start:4280 stop:5275 length:996 start_codon:yes stop_codon:yes gene_type:complete